MLFAFGQFDYLGWRGKGPHIHPQLLPGGVFQFLDSIRNGYWHARGPELLDQRAAQFMKWPRMPADLVFIVGGVVPLVTATLLIWRRAAKLPAT